jgi:hypothetical protein
MSLNSKARALLFAEESTYGNAVPLTGNDYIQTSRLKWKPVSSTVSREIDRPSFGGDIKLHIGVHSELEFDVEFAGSGAAGTAPKWGRLMKACKMVEAIVAATSVSYKFASGSTSSGTAYFQLNGQRHAMVGCRGSWKLKFTSQGIPYLGYMYKGLWVAPSSVPDLAPNTAGWTMPRIVTKANTQQISYDGHNAVFMDYELDAKNQVEHFDNPGEEFVGIVDRECEGSVKMLAPAISAKDFFTRSLIDNAIAALNLTHGTVAGNILSVLCPAVQLLEPNYGEERKRVTLEAKTSIPFAGTSDNEVEILCT